MQPITINLSESRNARVFDQDNLIHYEELRKATHWIQERINSLDIHPYPGECLHDTISILGG